jgi:NAD(P)-dependent dehydrogenase (short-subunit alcohol dehydrogenase family)
MNASFDLTGRTALVTGGASGIGRGIAEGLSRAGATVVVADLSASGPPPEGCTLIALDVTDSQSIERAVSALDRLDILVNAAGIIRRTDEYDPEIFERVVAVNLNGTMRMCFACRPLLAERGGAVVNLASMLSFFGAGLAPGYGASKGGVAQLTKGLAVGWAAQGIRVNAVAPGWIATPLTQVLQDDPARGGAILARTPLGRWGKPEDIAGPVVFLCSPAAAFVTGVVLPVDGGYLVA